MTHPLFNEMFPPGSDVLAMGPSRQHGVRLTVVEHSDLGLFARDEDGDPVFVPATAPFILIGLGSAADDGDVCPSCLFNNELPFEEPEPEPAVESLWRPRR